MKSFFQFLVRLCKILARLLSWFVNVTHSEDRSELEENDADNSSTKD